MGDRLDAPHTARAARFGPYLEEPDVTGVLYVRAPAEFFAEIAELHDVHLVPVFVAEEHQRAHLLRFFERNVSPMLELDVFRDLFVDDVLDLRKLLRRSLLRNAQSQNGDSCGATSDPAWCTCVPSTFRSAAWTKMRCRVVAHDGKAAGFIDFRYCFNLLRWPVEWFSRI